MNSESRVFLELYQESKKYMPNMQLINASTLEMPDDEFNNALKKLQEQKIISGLRVTKDYSGKIINVYTSNVQLTENAEKYYNQLYLFEDNKVQKKKKIFISHSSEDLRYVKALVELLESINVPEDGIFCSSLPGYCIPLNKKIFDYIREQLLEYEVKVYIVLSDNFCANNSCISEMGFFWALLPENFLFFLPGFDIDKTPKLLNPEKMGVKLDDEISIVKERLREIRDDLISFFNLSEIKEAKWERKRDVFMREIGIIE